MENLAFALLNVTTAETYDQTITKALAVLVDFVQPDAAILLVWDADLSRYIVGDTWLKNTNGNEAGFRRKILRLVAGQDVADATPREVEMNVIYVPLNVGDRHIGVYVYEGGQSLAIERDACQLLVQSVAKAISTHATLQQATREHNELEAEQERLQELLQAVERQQYTIDYLLKEERILSASLEAKVEERTAALWATQKRLIQSEKLAVIGQLASSLAHELNNPLQAMQSGLGLIMGDLDMGSTEYIKNDLTIIQDELERIQSIFNQMLDFYRPAAHDNVPLDINAICEGVRVLMRKHLQTTCVMLHLRLAELLPLTCGDSNQIKQVLLNLLLNAAEAMGDDGGNITLQSEHKGRQLCLSVIDDGPGIAAEHKTRLFEPLFTTKTRGLGLGLAISQEIIERHRGTITVQDNPEGGTIFTVMLPVQEACNGHS